MHIDAGTDGIVVAGTTGESATLTKTEHAGVIEAVRVSRVGYPHRYAHTAFVARYRILAVAELKKAQRGTKRVKPASVVVNALAAKVWKVQCDQERAQSGDGAEEKKDDDKDNNTNHCNGLGKLAPHEARQGQRDPMWMVRYWCCTTSSA